MTQRPIKFRLAVTSPHWDENPGSTKLSEPLTLGEIIDHQQIDFTDGGYLDWDDIDWGKDAVRFLQFTGLKDKNGIEIYEDDLLFCPAGHPSWDRSIVVAYGRQEFADDAYSEECMGWNVPIDPRIKVIGNTIQHPELLPHA